jgi:hypothetical protein
VAPDGYIEDATDCDDSDDQTYPGAQEICGGPDRDCDEMDPAPCTSCAELLEVGTGTESGVYTIDVDGPEQPLPSTDVWCDQETEGGGWTLVQRTVWDPTETIALRTDFATWYGQTLGDPAEGRGFRLQGEAWPYLDATQEHMLRHDIRQTSGESCDPLYYLGSEGELTVDEQTATLTGLVSDASMISGTELSTTDAGPSTNCINNNLGVPWFFGSCCATCPTYQGGYWNEPHPMANYVHTVPDAQGNTEADVCSTTVEMALDGSAFRGIASMAYYLR